MSIIPFEFPDTGQAVRTVTIDGEPWFVGRDVANVLGYSNPTRDVARHTTEGQRGVYRIGTPSGEQDVVVISEPGAYRLIMRSNLPAAERFQCWLAEEVIPSIRRTGSYSAAPALPDLMTPQGVLALAAQFHRTAEQLVEADHRIKELEPKALVHDTLMAAKDGDVLIRQAAKVLGWQEKQLRAFLVDEKLLYRRQATCGAGQYDFYAAHADCFNAVERLVEHTWGSCAHYTLHVTPRGIAFIQMRITKRRSEMAAAIEGGVR